LFEKSKKAFEEGKKDEAKQLSEKAKKHGENFEKMNKEAGIHKNYTKGENIFKEINKNNGELLIDLHGLFVEEALEFVKNRIIKLKGFYY
jgi:hypothetical protein